MADGRQMATCFDRSCGHHRNMTFTRKMRMPSKGTYMGRTNISV